jgi:hypothetical protein
MIGSHPTGKGIGRFAAVWFILLYIDFTFQLSTTISLKFSRAKVWFGRNMLRANFNAATLSLLNAEYGNIYMHNLLEEMGKEIIHEESSKEPGKHNRLWSYKDILQVLTKNTVSMQFYPICQPIFE